MKPTDAERAYTQIKKQIVRTTMAPGSVISEAQMMNELKLGRTPIREAIKRLQAENLVTVTPRRGMFVADITVTDLTQIFEVRIAIEALATRLATQRITPAQLARLQQFAHDYQLASLDDKNQLIELDEAFHLLLAKAAHNKFLEQDLQHYYNLSLRIWYLAINYAQPQDIDVIAHIEILDAIEAGDADRAALRMETHIRDFHKTIKQYL